MKKFAITCLFLPALVLLTGCPSDQYTIELTPHGNVIERNLVFYRKDVDDTNKPPNYERFPSNQLARIARLYPSSSLKTNGGLYSITGTFLATMPEDIGGSGQYTNMITMLGSTGIYLERFRGDDDLATSTTKRLRAADKLTDLVIGWTRMELGREHGFEKLRRFLDTDFRRDVKNMSMYELMLQTSSATRSEAPEEFAVRFGQYLTEHGYLQMADMPAVFALAANDPKPLMQRIQRLVASKMGIPRNMPIPQSLAFLSDADKIEQSWDKYLMTTDAYRAVLRRWKKEKLIYEIHVAEQRVQGFYNARSRTNALPAAPKKPSSSVAVQEIYGELMPLYSFMDNIQHDHVTVRLSLPSAPVRSNGRWNAERKQVVWESNLESSDASEKGRVPSFCYASWSVPDEAAQRRHFGRVLLSGEELTQYCLWRAGLDEKEANEWDTLLAGLLPGDELKEKIETFRFSSEMLQTVASGQSQSTGPSDFIRSLLSDALKKAPGIQSTNK